jgi:hypothetical protein
MGMFIRESGKMVWLMGMVLL